MLANFELQESEISINNISNLQLRKRYLNTCNVGTVVDNATIQRPSLADMLHVRFSTETH